MPNLCIITGSNGTGVDTSETNHPILFKSVDHQVEFYVEKKKWHLSAFQYPFNDNISDIFDNSHDFGEKIVS